MRKKAHRRHELIITIKADEMLDIEFAITEVEESIRQRIQSKVQDLGCWSIGNRTSWIIEYVEDPSMTNEQYMSDIRRELTKEDAEKDKG